MADEASCAAAARLHLATTSRRESALAGVPTGCLCVERRHASNAVAAFRQHIVASLGKKATHTHKLGTPRIVRGTSLLVIPVSSEEAAAAFSPLLLTKKFSQVTISRTPMRKSCCELH